MLRPLRALSCCLIALVTMVALLGAGPGPVPSSAEPTGDDPLAERLARAFRSDLNDVRVRLDYFPRRERVRGRAALDLTLRAGQRRVLFHFNPLRDRGARHERSLLRTIRLDGERIAPRALRRVRGTPGAEVAFEIRRNLEPGSRHTLVVTWAAPAATPRAQWLFPMFDDTEGPGDETETMWPTVSSPEALARHRILVRVHGRTAYTVLGSGKVRRVRSGPRLDAWRLDTQRAVSSSTVFFAAVPRREVRRERLRVRGVDVRIVSDRSPRRTRAAAKVTRRTIRNLERRLGPFPVPRMAVLLTGWGSGMEYYGATRTGLGSLRHELGHMYFGTTAVNRTWRDTWFDESAVVWWDERRRIRPVPRRFRSSIALGRRAAAPGFNERAYGAGARVLARIARAMGGNAAMLAFLADLHRRRAFEPFTTDDFIDDVVDAQDRIGRRALERWLLGG